MRRDESRAKSDLGLLVRLLACSLYHSLQPSRLLKASTTALLVSMDPLGTIGASCTSSNIYVLPQASLVEVGGAGNRETPAR